MAELVRTFVRHESCNATKDDLLSTGAKVTDDCLVCQDAGFLCRIACHPSPAGMFIVESIFIFILHRSHNNSSTFSFSIPIAKSFSSSVLPPYEQHPPPHPPQVCSTLRRTNLHSTLFFLNIPMHFLSLSYESMCPCLMS